MSSAASSYVFSDLSTYRFILQSSECEPLGDLWLEGYQIYIVEQWACSRQNMTSVVTVYTGSSEDKV